MFFVVIVTAAALIEVVKGRGDGGSLLPIESPAGGLCGDRAEDMQETLDAAVAVGEHAEGVVESAVWFCANLYGHVGTCGKNVPEIR